ncbi:hypothetical protein [Bacillus alkalicellulosilyticus]|uniref:hypothetical protein n=1 Tax=Alkalihalobacterium alkalicellulosilyticum TaxID=1912214 RepID=UPI000997C4AC|nr:hypothetical protein [Bacillus alkalicellulosilyticus]
MEITAQMSSSKSGISEKNVRFRQGEFLQATIKERKSANEATLLIKGKEVSATFADKVPSGDRVLVQFDKTLDNQTILVKEVTTDTQTKSDSAKSSSSSGQATSPEVKQALQTLEGKGIAVTKEGISEIKNFFESSSGSTQEKLATIRALAEKELPISRNHIQSVHTALHGKQMNEVMSDIARQIDSDYIPQPKNSHASVEQMVREVTNMIERDTTIDDSTKRRIEQALKEARYLHQMSNEKTGEAARQLEKVAMERIMNALMPSDVQGPAPSQSSIIETAKQVLQKEPDAQRAFQQIQQLLLGKTEHHELLTSTMEKASSFLSQGREMSARQQVMEALVQMENLSSKGTDQTGQVYVNQEAFQTSIQPVSKDIVVTTITEKLAQAAADFKKLQREINRNLDSVIRIIDQTKQRAQHQVKPLLEATIHKLDQAILKSDMMMLTDMKTEKSLLQASSHLAEAKKRLQKGQYQEAQRIVSEVKATVEKIQFKPSETKVMHFVSQQQVEGRTPQQQLLQHMNETIRPPQDPSARQMFELVRSLGLNRESEIGQMLSSSNRDMLNQEGQQRNMKALLMQLIRSEEEGSRVAQQATQALQNITGQQLLSKSDATNQQQLFLQLPFLLQNHVENLQVFVNSRNEGQQVDWENCQLYFKMETPKLGEVGILVGVQERLLTVTVKNDLPEFKEKMEPLVEKCVKMISDIGFSIQGINYSKLSNIEEAQEQKRKNTETTSQPIFTEKGFDYKI